MICFNDANQGFFLCYLFFPVAARLCLVLRNHQWGAWDSRGVYFCYSSFHVILAKAWISLWWSRNVFCYDGFRGLPPARKWRSISRQEQLQSFRRKTLQL